MQDVFVIGVGMTPFAKHPDRSVKDLSREAVAAALRDAGLGVRDVDAVWFANSGWGYFSRQHCIRGQVALRDTGLAAAPVFNVENACAGGATAFHSAFLGVASGAYRCALAVGTEKLTDPDKAKAFGLFFTGTDVERLDEVIPTWQQMLGDLPPPPVADEPGAGVSRSFVMDVYACMVRWHMARYGTTQRQLATICSKNHAHGALNPYAQHRKELSVEEVLASRPVVWPLTVPMCAPMGDGSAAALLCSREYLRTLAGARPVKVLASVMGSHTPRAFADEDEDVAIRVSRAAYERAGVGPQDVDVAELHDASSFGELHITEALGFCPRGEGGALAESGATRLGGRLPVNPSGGLESRGHPIGASGLGQICELVTQLRGEAGARQVSEAQIGLAENGGGFLYAEEAALCVHLFEANPRS